jgi:hypothetical protein
MKTKLMLLLLGAGLILASCTKYPPESDRLLEDLAVVTQYDTGVNFNNYKTFSMPDKIMKVTDKDTTVMTGSTAEAALKQVDANMKSRGFVPVVGSAKPDLGVQVLYFQNTTVYTYYYDYWGYGYYYPYYPYYPVYYSSYTTGLADIQLLDLKNTGPDNRVAIVWNAFIRGLLTGSHTTQEITGKIDQAFIQTPTLKTTP